MKKIKGIKTQLSKFMAGVMLVSTLMGVQSCANELETPPAEEVVVVESEESEETTSVESAEEASSVEETETTAETTETVNEESSVEETETSSETETTSETEETDEATESTESETAQKSAFDNLLDEVDTAVDTDTKYAELTIVVPKNTVISKNGSVITSYEEIFKISDGELTFSQPTAMEYKNRIESDVTVIIENGSAKVFFEGNEVNGTVVDELENVVSFDGKTLTITNSDKMEDEMPSEEETETEEPSQPEETPADYTVRYFKNSVSDENLLHKEVIAGVAGQEIDIEGIDVNAYKPNDSEALVWKNGVMQEGFATIITEDDTDIIDIVYVSEEVIVAAEADFTVKYYKDSLTEGNFLGEYKQGGNIDEAINYGLIDVNKFQPSSYGNGVIQTVVSAILVTKDDSDIVYVLYTRVEKEIQVVTETIEVPGETIEKIVEVPVEKIVEVPVEVEKIIEVPVEVEKIVEVEKEVEKIIEVPGETVYVEVPGETIVVEKEVPVEVEKIVTVEIPVEVEKIVEKIVEIEKEVPVETIIEKLVEVEKEVEVIKEVPVIVEVPIEKVVTETVLVPVEVEKLVEVTNTVETEKIVEVPGDSEIVYVEVPVETVKEVEKIVEKKVPVYITVETDDDTVTTFEEQPDPEFDEDTSLTFEDGPQTGDTTNIVVLVLIMVLALMGMAVMKRKNKKNVYGCYVTRK